MFVLCSALLLVTHAPSAPADLIQNVKNKLFLDAPGRPWKETVLSGKGRYNGVDDRYTLRFRPDGMFVSTLEGGLNELEGFDGSDYWQQNHSGTSRTLAFEDVDELMGSELLQTNRWLEPGAGVSLVAAGNTIHISNRSGFKEDIEIDPVTYLPKSATFPLSAGPVKVTLSDWRAAGSRLLPFHVEIIAKSGNVDSYTIDKVTQATDSDPASYKAPAQTTGMATFDASKASTITVKHAETGHLLVHPMVNGKDIGWFILDSGAETMCVDTKIANDNKLGALGVLPMTGIGGTVQGHYRPVKEFSLGPVTLKNALFVELDLQEISAFLKIPIAGIVGNEFFDHAIVSVDTKLPSVSVFDPATYKLSTGKWAKMQFESGNPLVEASTEGDRRGWYRIDTGDSGTITYYGPYVEREKLLDGRETTDGQLGGVGGLIPMKSGKAKWFELGGHRFEDVPAAYALGKEGGFADRYIAGNIGQALLTPFTVVFDYAQSRVAFISKE